MGVSVGDTKKSNNLLNLLKHTIIIEINHHLSASGNYYSAFVAFHRIGSDGGASLTEFISLKNIFAEELGQG